MPDVDSSFDEAWAHGGEIKIATDLLTRLKEIRNLREKTPARRWIWELIQNAVDCATHNSLKVELEYAKPERSFIFRHDGRAFLQKEVAALIQSWSTKLEDKTQEGKFAEGFLQSHAVSEEIIVQGNLEEKQSFRFKLDRTGKSIGELLGSLERAKEVFKKSISSEWSHWHAQFEYMGLDEKALSIIDLSLANLESVAPLVVALSPKLSEIRVISQTGVKYWKKGATEEIKKMDETDKTAFELRYVICDDFSNLAVAVMTVGETRIAVLGIPVENGMYSLMNLGEIPKLFSRYPLWGTSQFGSFVIIDGRFEVHTDRSGPILGSGTESQYNKGILMDALKRVPDFLKMLSNKRWKNLGPAAQVSTLQPKGKLQEGNFDFLKESFKSLVSCLSNLPLVPIEGSDSLVPASQSIIPHEKEALPAGDQEWRPLWELLRDLNPQKVVKWDSTPLWTSVLREWTETSGEDYHKFGGMSVLDIVKEVKNAGSLAALTTRLRSDENRALDFLRRLYHEIVRGGESLRDLGILPNESGIFVQEVEIDPGIDPELLTVAEALGFSPRNKLLYSKVAQFEEFKWIEILRSLNVGGLEGQILEKIQNTVDKKSILTPSARYLRWLIKQKNRTGVLETFPFVFVSETKETKGKIEQPYFAPRSRWNPATSAHISLFDLATLADEYDQILESSDWKILEDLGIVTTTFVTEKTIALTADVQRLLLAESLPEEVRKCVLPKEFVVKTVPNLSFLLHARVRESKEKSLSFLTFLLMHLGTTDKSWKERVDLSCGNHNRTHKFSRCLWLAMSKEREWVWEGKDQADKPSTQNLKNLLRGQSKPELIEALNSQDSRALLTCLGLPPHELALALATQSIEEEQLLGNRIFEVVQPLREHPAALANLAKLAQKLPPSSLETLATLAERADLVSDLEKIANREQLIKDNQSLGEKVETIVRKLIQRREREGRWLVVDGVRVGADAAVKLLTISEEGVTIELAKFLLEIKSTRRDQVNLTPAQVKTAVKHPDTFFLCVLPLMQDEKPEALEDDVALERIKVVSRVVDHLEPRYREVCGVKDATSGEEVWVENLNDLRYAVGERVWASAPNLEQWIDQLLIS